MRVAPSRSPFRRRSRRALGVAIALVLVGCGKDAPPRSPPTPAASAGIPPSVVAALGHVELAVLVRPAERSGATPLWSDGGRSKFNEFVDAEIPLWQPSKASGGSYPQTRPDLRLVPLAERGAARRDDFVLVSTRRVFTEADLVVRQARALGNGVALELSARPERKYDFEEWTREHTGRGLALVADGAAVTVVTNEGAVSDRFILVVSSATPLGRRLIDAITASRR